MDTTCINETRYRLTRALRSRCTLTILNEDSYLAEYGTIGRFKLTLMPGNRRVLISSGVVVNEGDRGKGYGKKMLAMREEIAKYAGINLLLATVREDNAREIHILETNGWKRLNKRDTGVCLWGKEI